MTTEQELLDYITEKIGGHTVITPSAHRDVEVKMIDYIKSGHIDVTATLNFPDTAANTQSDLTVALATAALGDFVVVAAPVAALTVGHYSAFVSSTGVITVRYHNPTASASNPPSGDFKLRVLK